MVYDFLNWILIGVYNTTVWFVGACCFGAYWTAPLRVVIAVSRSLRLILYKISLPYIHIHATGKVNQGAIFISIIFWSVLCKVRIFFSLCTEYTRGINKSFNRKWYFRQSNCCSKLSKELGKGVESALHWVYSQIFTTRYKCLIQVLVDISSIWNILSLS